MDNQPLADKMRPTQLSDVVGQDHIIGPSKILTKIIKSKIPVSLIFWGPPGSGKTSLARIIAHELHADFLELSAVTSAKADITKAIERAKANQRLAQKTVLFIDEIHRFNKAQQDAFLPHMEEGTITLLGATTENPSFEVITPLLSRSRVIELKSLSKQSVITLLRRILVKENIDTKKFTTKSLDYIAESSNGDARIAIGNIELLLNLNRGIITPDVVKATLQKRAPNYDKNGQYHYNFISAFIKSMRGSDSEAALYYLERMMQGGEDPKFIARRLIIFASEDIGPAAPQALNLANSTFQAVEKIGYPECEYALYQCTYFFSKCKKSRHIANIKSKTKQTVEQFPNLAVPAHLINTPAPIKHLQDSSETSPVGISFGFLPEELQKINYQLPTD
ncbi:MAG: replication-associated recombination protein A [Candidatus Saccharimonadales bacterium]